MSPAHLSSSRPLSNQFQSARWHQNPTLKPTAKPLPIRSRTTVLADWASGVVWNSASTYSSRPRSSAFVGIATGNPPQLCPTGTNPDARNAGMADRNA